MTRSVVAGAGDVRLRGRRGRVGGGGGGQPAVGGERLDGAAAGGGRRRDRGLGRAQPGRLPPAHGNGLAVQNSPSR